MLRQTALCAFRRVQVCAAAPVVCAAALTSSTSPAALSSVFPTIAMSARAYGPQDGRRLTYEERADRRLNKNRVGREERQALQLEAEKIATIEFVEDLEREFDIFFGKAQTAALKITNMQRCIETIEIDVGGRKVPILQACQIVKVSPLELHVIPTQAAFASPILQRLMRFDSTITAQKEQAKIKLTLQRTTTQRRDKATNDISTFFTEFANKVKAVRLRYSKLIAGVGAGDDVVQQLMTVVDTTLKDFVELKQLEFEELKQTVSSTGVDESDDAV